MIVARIDSYLVQATAKRHGSCWLGCATILIAHDGDPSRQKGSVIHFGLKECSQAAEQAALDEARRHIRRRITAPMARIRTAASRRSNSGAIENQKTFTKRDA